MPVKDDIREFILDGIRGSRPGVGLLAPQGVSVWDIAEAFPEVSGREIHEVLDDMRRAGELRFLGYDWNGDAIYGAPGKGEA